MEARVAVLETHVEIMRKDIADLKTGVVDIKVQLARLDTNVGHLPSKGYIFRASSLTLAIITALIAFQQQIQHFLHTGP